MVWLPYHAGTFLDFIEGERLYALFCLVAYCGLRRGEAIGLAWGRTGPRPGARVYPGDWDGEDPKSEAGVRAVPLPAVVVAALRAWRKRQMQEKLAWGPDWPETGPGLHPRGWPAIPPQWVSVRHETLAYRAGLPPVRGARP